MGAADEAVTALEIGTNRHPSDPKMTLCPVSRSIAGI